MITPDWKYSTDRADDEHVLKEIVEQIGPDRHRCYQALRAVLFSLRDAR